MNQTRNNTEGDYEYQSRKQRRNTMYQRCPIGTYELIVEEDETFNIDATDMEILEESKIVDSSRLNVRSKTVVNRPRNDSSGATPQSPNIV